MVHRHDRIITHPAPDTTPGAPTEAKPRKRRGSPTNPNNQPWGEANANGLLIRIPRLMVGWIGEHSKKSGPEGKVAVKVTAATVLDDGSAGVYLTKGELKALLALSGRMRDGRREAKDRHAVAEAAARIRRLAREPYNIT